MSNTDKTSRREEAILYQILKQAACKGQDTLNLVWQGLSPATQTQMEKHYQRLLRWAATQGEQ